MSDFLGSSSPWASVTLLLLAAVATLVISALSIALGFVIALPVCVARIGRHRVAASLAWFYVSFFRGVPLLVQLMVCYYALPSLGIELPSYAAAIIAMAVCTAAYQAENLRSGFLALPPGQAAAARAFGYSDRQILFRILLPQALRLALPTVVNEMVAMVKASSVISIVGIAEITRVSENIVARTQQAISWYGLAALFYLVISLGVARLGHRAERRLNRGVAQAQL
jgi:polar amino acid transport system permease protein